MRKRRKSRKSRKVYLHRCDSLTVNIYLIIINTTKSFFAVAALALWRNFTSNKRKRKENFVMNAR